MKRRIKAFKKIKSKLSSQVYVIGIIAVLVAVVYVGALQLNPALLSFVTGTNQLATPLPFGSECYKSSIFECTDYAYEYCKYNPDNSCFMLILKGFNYKPGHAINIVKKGIDRRTSRVSVIEPQSGTEIPITSWIQSTHVKVYIPNANLKDLENRYGDDIGMKNTDKLDASHIEILPWNTKYQDYYIAKYGNQSHKQYWAEGWFAANQLRSLTDEFYKLYKPKQKIATCASLQGDSCTMGGVVNSSTANIEPAARVCIDKLGYPATIACMNNKMVQLERYKDVATIEMKPVITASSYCPMSEIDSQKTVSYIVTMPQLALPTKGQNNSTYYQVSLYINDKVVQRISTTTYPVRFTVDASQYTKNKAHFLGFYQNEVFAIVTVFDTNTKNTNNPLPSELSNVVPMNVGNKGCIVAWLSRGNGEIFDNIYYKPGVRQTITNADRYSWINFTTQSNFPAFQLQFKPTGWMPKASQQVPSTISNLTSVTVIDVSKQTNASSAVTPTSQPRTGATTRPSYTPATTVIPNTPTNTNTQTSNGSGIMSQGSGVGSGS